MINPVAMSARTRQVVAPPTRMVPVRTRFPGLALMVDSVGPGTGPADSDG